MRKNAAKVIGAFNQGKAAQDGALMTNGEEVFSYAMRIAWREAGRVWVVSKEASPSKTTSAHIGALMVAFPEAVVVGEVKRAKVMRGEAVSIH